MSSQKSDKNYSIKIIFIKLLWRSILRSILRIPVSLEENTTLQLGTNFNDARELITTLSHILWGIYLSGHYTIKKACKKRRLCHIFLEFYVAHEKNRLKETTMKLLSYTFPEACSIQERIYCSRVSINSFITIFFLNHIAFRDKF